MGYRIEYISYRDMQEKQAKTKKYILLLMLLISVSTVFIRYQWPAGWDLFCRILIPGDPETTVSALEVFLLELSQGTPLPDAVTAFCEIVLHNEILS